MEEKGLEGGRRKACLRHKVERADETSDVVELLYILLASF